MAVDAREPQTLRYAANQIGGGFRIAAGKQRDVVTLSDKFLRKPGNDPLCTAIELRRHRLGQRGYLSDTHFVLNCLSFVDANV
jgi:hypothetical protein